MNTRAFPLSAAALLIAASAAHATPSESQRYADRAKGEAQRLLRSSRLDIAGRVTGVDLVRSYGSRDADRAVETLLRRVVASDPPMGLADGAVLMTVSAAPSV